MNEEFLKEMADILDVENVNLDDCLQDFASWDSLATLSLISLIDTMFGLTVRGTDIEDTMTIGDVLQMIQAKKNG